MQEWQAAVDTSPQTPVPLQARLAAAKAQNAELQQHVLQLAFRDTDAATGQPIRRDAAQLAPLLGLPGRRCAQLLRSAIRATPLATDDGPIDVIYEDEWLLAVNKPPGLRAHPIHRHEGNSALSRVLRYLGYPPKVCPHGFVFQTFSGRRHCKL